MIMSGSKDATIQDIQRVSLPGTEFYDVIFAHDDEPGQLRRVRVGSEAIYAQPQAGDAVCVSYLMNVPTNIARRAN